MDSTRLLSHETPSVVECHALHDEDSPPPPRTRFIVTGCIWTLIALGCAGFLCWDHFAYKDESPPPSIAIVRDVCATLLALCFVCVSVFMSLRIGGGTQGGARAIGAHRIYVSVFVLYVFAGIYWFLSHMYYDIGNHPMPESVFVIRMISIVYVGICTVILGIAALSQCPPEAAVVCCCFLE